MPEIQIVTDKLDCPLFVSETEMVVIEKLFGVGHDHQEMLQSFVDDGESKENEISEYIEGMADMDTTEHEKASDYFVMLGIIERFETVIKDIPK